MAPLFGHDVGDAEAVADFDQLTAGDDHLAAFRERVEHQEDGRGVVVDDDRGFGADERREQPRGVTSRLPRSPLSTSYSRLE